VRLDSGDLGVLARQVRQLLDEAGLPSVRILVSGGLDELDIDALVRGGAPIDAFGVGTRMGVSADAPYLDSAYKLVQYGERPVLKLSPGKLTAPGAKQVFRRPGMAGDVVALRDEPAPAGCERLLDPVMVGGRRVGPAAGVAAARQCFEADLAVLPAAARDLRAPQAPPVHFSDGLTALAEQTRANIARRIFGGSTGLMRRSLDRGALALHTIDTRTDR
jgi:nicotinate phosphoribosyltransferase